MKRKPETPAAKRKRARYQAQADAASRVGMAALGRQADKALQEANRIAARTRALPPA